MDFGEALAVLRAGGRVARESWGDSSAVLKLELPGEMPYARMTEPYISSFLQREDQVVPWSPTQSDMLSLDWVEIQYEISVSPGILLSRDGKL